MVNNPYQSASQAYQKKSDDNLTPLQIVVEMYKGMLRNVKLSKQFWKEGNYELMSQYIIKTFDILEALQSNLDMENGGEDAQFLHRFYSVLFSALSQASSKPNPSEYFDEIIVYIQQVHDRWYKMAYGDLPIPEDEATPPQTEQ